MPLQIALISAEESIASVSTEDDCWMLEPRELADLKAIFDEASSGLVRILNASLAAVDRSGQASIGNLGISNWMGSEQ